MQHYNNTNMDLEEFTNKFDMCSKTEKSEQDISYVTTIDTFMSGWGMAEGKTNIMIFKCDNWNEVLAVMTNANNRTDQRMITFHGRIKPVYNKDQFYAQAKTIIDCPRWYKQGAF